MRHEFTFTKIQPKQIESTFEGATLIRAMHHEEEGLVYFEFEKNKRRRTLIIGITDSEIEITNEYPA